MEYNDDKIDDAVLALLYLTMFSDGPGCRAWKGHAWSAMDRLCEKRKPDTQAALVEHGES
jgi:hypothetical protein